jgi:hypothetical protein
MVSPNLIQLAPTLSVEERYRIIVPDCYRVMAGEKGMLSVSEIDAITTFDKTAVWEQYALRVGMFKWAHILWLRDIQSEKFCACTCILLLNHQLWQVIWDGDEPLSKEQRAKELETLRKYVDMLQIKLGAFYAYREALARLQEELYGLPIFDEKTDESIQGFYKFVGDMLEIHNKTVRELCADKDTKRYFKQIASEMDLYLVKESLPTEASITELIDEVKSFAESDVKARSRR